MQPIALTVEMTERAFDEALYFRQRERTGSRSRIEPLLEALREQIGRDVAEARRVFES